VEAHHRESLVLGASAFRVGYVTAKFCRADAVAASPGKASSPAAARWSAVRSRLSTCDIGL